MSTNAKIGITDENGHIEAIYVHWDGYPEHIAPLLLDHYNTPDKINELIKLGSLSALYEKIKPEPGVPHSFDKPAENVTVAYRRDRGESWYNTKPEQFESKAQYAKAYGPHKYLFDIKQNKWLYTRNLRFRAIPKKYSTKCCRENN